MANGGQVNYSIKFNVDKTSLTALNKELTQIQLQAAEMAKSPKGLTEELKKASDAASVLQDALNSSWNEKLNQINLNKFNTTLKNSGTTAQDLMQKLATGPANAQIAFNNLTRSLVTTNVQLKTTSKILDSFAVTFKNTVRYGISSSIFNNLSNSISKAYDYSVKLDKSLNDIRIVSDKSAADMERFAISANKAARELGRSTLDYTKASTIFFQQGLDDIDVEARTQATLKAANVTGQSGEAVSEQLTAVWNGYKVSAEETELYVDKLAAVAASTAADLEELSTGMSKVASAANIMGVDIDQLNAQLATVVSVTRQAPESVGTAFKTIYARMGDIKAGLDDEVTLGNYTEKMAALGVNVLNANGELRDMGDVIEEIGGKWNTMSREQQIALSQIMAGQRQYNNLLSLFDNWNMYTDALNTSKNAAGELQREQDIYMETTEAHLQQLRTEAERTYATLFDKEAVNGFYDTTRVLLDEFNDWIEGLGGGINAIINLVSQLGIVFRKQIGESIVRNIDNIKQWRLENQINLGQIKKYADVYKEIEDKIKTSRQQNVIQAQNMPAELQNKTQDGQDQKENAYLQEVNKNTDELIVKEKELLQVKNYVSGETFNEIQNNLKDAAALKDKIAYYRVIKENIQSLKGEDFGQDDASQMIEDGKEGLRELTEQYGELRTQIQNVNVTLKQHDDFYAEDSTNQSLEQQKQNLAEILMQYDSLWLQAVDNKVLTQEEYEQKKEVFDLDKLINLENKDDQNAEAERERLLNALRKQRNELQQRYNGLINEGQDLEVAFDEQTQMQLEKDLQDKEQQINDPINQANRNKAASQYTSMFFGLTQAATAAVGAFKVLGQAGATGAEKMSGIWSGVSGSIAGIANMIAPGSGFIIQGVAELGKGILEITGIWDKWSESMKSTAEKLQDIDNEIQKIREDAQKAQSELDKKINDYESGVAALEEFEGIKARFDALQEMAEKGLLTPELRTEYEGYLKKVQEYNKEAIISYDAQGNKIAANSQLMQETIDKLKQLNQQNFAKMYNGESWDQGVKVATADAQVAKREYKKSVVSRTSEWGLRGGFDKYTNDDDVINNMDRAQDLVDKINDISNYVNDAEQLEKDLQELQSIFEEGSSWYYMVDESSKINKYTDAVTTSFANYAQGRRNSLEVVQKEYDEYQAELKKMQLDSSFLYNHLLYNEDKNEEYNQLASSFGEQQTQTFLQNYIEGLRTGWDEFSTDGIIDYNALAEHIQQVQKELTEVFAKNLNLKAAVLGGLEDLQKQKFGSSQEYEDAVIAEMNKIMATITSKEEFDAIIPRLAAIYGLESTSGFAWDSTNNKATFGANGTNVVTKGERSARNIGQMIAAQNVDNENLTDSQSKTLASDYIENYLQDTLDEVSLQNLDKTKFVSDFNHFLYQAMEEVGEDGELPLDDVLQKTLERQGLGQEEINLQKALTKNADDTKKFDLDEGELKLYSKHLMDVADESKELSDDLEENAEAAVTVAQSVMRMNKGVETLADNLDDWRSVLKKSDKSSQEYADAVDGMKGALSDLFDVSKDAISRDFIESLKDSKEGLRLLEQAANGNAKAIDQLRDKYADKLILEIAAQNDIPTDTQNQLSLMVNELQSEIPDIKIGATITADDPQFADFFNKCMQVINAAEMTEEQANAFFDAIGFDAQVETDYKKEKTKEPVTETTEMVEWKDSNITYDAGDGNKETRHAKAKHTITSTKTIGYTESETVVPVVAMATNGKTPQIKSITKKGTGSSNNYSSSNKGGGSPGKSGGGGGKGGKGGGSSSKPKKIDKTQDESDRYHKVNTQIEKTANNLDKLGKAEEKALGGDWVKNLTQQFQLLNNQIANYNEKLRIANGEQDELRKQLAGQGVAFNADGTISNYNAAFDAQLAKLNALEDQYNHLSAAQQEKWDENKTLDKAKEDFSKFKENMNRYDELVSSFIPDLQKQIQEAIDQIVEKQIEKFNKGIDLRLDMAEAERDWNEFKTKVIDGIDEDDIIGQTQAKIRDFATYYDKNTTGSIQALTNHLNDIMNEMNKKVSNVYGKDDAKELEDLRKYYEELMEEMEGVFDLQKEIHENYLDMLDEAQDKFDEQVEAYEMVSDLIEHDMNLIELVYGEGAYTELGKFYEKQAENNKKQLEFQKQQVAFWREVMNSEEKGSKEWENAKEKWTSATSDLNNLIETSIKNLQDKYLNAIEGIFDKLNDEITKGKGLDFIDTEWQLINKGADQYLDTINQLFETQALENKYLDAIDQTDNIAAQRKLKDLMDEELTALREKDKLTKYDIERANKRYEIALKQIALEEAQQNKSTMRLRRDSQGNYRYEYVADNDAIDQARDELEKLKNDLYNFDKAQYEESLNEMYDTWVEYQDALKEAAQINDPEERAAKEALIKEKYGDIINNMLAENAVIRQNLEQSAFEDLALLYDKNLEDYTNMTDAEKDTLMNDLVPAWGSGIQEMIDTMVGEGGFYPTCDEAFLELEHEQDNLSQGFEEIQDAGDVAFEAIANGTDTAIEKAKELIGVNEDVIDTYEEKVETMKNLTTQIDELANSFKKAGNEATGVIQKVHDLLKKTDEKNAAEYDKAAKAATTDKTVTNAINGNPTITTTSAPATATASAPAAPAASSFKGISNISGHDALVDVVWGVWQGRYGNGAARRAALQSAYGVEGQKIIQGLVNNTQGYTKSKTKLGNRLSALGYDTGGYTGSWNNNGRLAFLHQKELVLNATDTENMLNAINVMRNLTNSVGIATLARLASLGASGSAGIGGNGLEQNVHISATFPNATSTREIEEALLNLTNRASQMIGRR